MNPPEERLGERLDRAGEVGHRDVAVDHQALDLVEHRHVRRVRRVATEHPARRDDVDRRFLGRASCGSARARCGSATTSCRRGPGRDMIDEQRVELTSSRVPVAHVQGLEVVPVGLHLRALGDLEAEADERVLETFPGLGDEVGVAALRAAHELGEVESLRLDPCVERLADRARRGGPRALRRPR